MNSTFSLSLFLLCAGLVSAPAATAQQPECKTCVVSYYKREQREKARAREELARLAEETKKADEKAELDALADELCNAEYARVQQAADVWRALYDQAKYLEAAKAAQEAVAVYDAVYNECNKRAQAAQQSGDVKDQVRECAQKERLEKQFPHAFWCACIKAYQAYQHAKNEYSDYWGDYWCQEEREFLEALRLEDFQ